MMSMVWSLKHEREDEIESERVETYKSKTARFLKLIFDKKIRKPHNRKCFELKYK